MHLANNNAIWQSRLGGAFGFSSIAARAGEQVNIAFLLKDRMAFLKTF
jgi:hypothetical protein